MLQKVVLWVGSDPQWFHHFSAYPDPFFFYLNADPDLDPDPESQTNADPGPGQTLPSQIVGF
jgi:hypothetical protein